MVKKKVKKTKETAKKGNRDSKGQFKKGCKGGPGRRKGEARDIVCKDGKKRSATALVDDLLGTYGKLGSHKFLYEWCLSSKRNLTLFIQLLYKFAPLPKAIDSSDSPNLTYQLSEQFMPKFNMPRPGDVIDKKMRQMEDTLRQRDAEIDRLKSIFETHGIDAEELQHEPIEAIELPEHSESELDEKIKDAEKRKEELEAELKEKGK